MSRRKKKRNQAKRTITIVLTPNDGTDPKELLKKLKDELDQQAAEVRGVRSTEDDDTVVDEIPEPQSIANEQLETSTREHVDKVLKQKNARIKAAEKAAEAKGNDSNAPVEMQHVEPKEIERESKKRDWGRAFAGFLREYSIDFFVRLLKELTQNRF